MPLDPRAEPEQLAALGFPAHDCMRIADRDRREVDTFVADVERLGLPHFDRPDVELDVSVFPHTCSERARADGNRDLLHS